jgi:short-subunit dehydrogenase
VTIRKRGAAAKRHHTDAEADRRKRIIRIEVSTMKLHLEGRTALITGASKGIGLAAARAFAAEGCHLHLAARNASALMAAKAEIEAASGVSVRTHALDLGEPGNMRKLSEAAGDVDILINNAGHYWL